MATSLFCALSSNRIAACLRAASQRVVYAAPGIQLEPAKALVELARRMAHSDLTVGLDFDEQTLRMGYGDLEAVRAIREANIAATHLPGFRSGILIVDNRGWIFTPVPRYLEQEPQSDETPNAIALSGAQVEIFMHPPLDLLFFPPTNVAQSLAFLRRLKEFRFLESPFGPGVPGRISSARIVSRLPRKPTAAFLRWKLLKPLRCLSVTVEHSVMLMSVSPGGIRSTDPSIVLNSIEVDSPVNTRPCGVVSSTVICMVLGVSGAE
jgi:hypothetical protein